MMGTLGLESNDIIWTDATYPTLSIMSSLSTFLSSTHFLRWEIFRICWSVALGQSKFCNLFKDIISLLKGTNMTHIILIDEYLYHRYKELLSVRMLAENHNGMTAIWEFLALLEEHERFFAKILYDKETTACLNRGNFPLHIAAAVDAAPFETPSMANYRGAEGQAQNSELLGNNVSGYLSMRLSVKKTAVINASAIFGSHYEMEEYRKLVDAERVGGSAAQATAMTCGIPATLQPPPV